MKLISYQDFTHLTPGRKVYYHWHLLPIGEEVALDLSTVGSAETDQELSEYRRMDASYRLVAASKAYARANGLTSSCSARAPYESVKMTLWPR